MSFKPCKHTLQNHANQTSTTTLTTLPINETTDNLRGEHLSCEEQLFGNSLSCFITNSLKMTEDSHPKWIDLADAHADLHSVQVLNPLTDCIKY